MMELKLVDHFFRKYFLKEKIKMAFRLPKLIIQQLDKIYIHKYFPWIIWHPLFHRVKGFEIRQILDIIKPGDILIRRNEGWLTAKAIPGYFMHAALYLGDNKVAHATTSGTGKEDILDFFRTDSVALLRSITNLEQIKKAILLGKKMANEHIPYDFEFKDKNGKVYCTEFINICYEGLFNSDYTKDAGGGNSIIPDGLYNSKKVKKIIEFRH